MELKHSYAEYLVKKATQRGLWPWERLFLQAHLAACPDCFHTALGLAEVIHESEVAGLRGKELSLLHQRLMVKVRQEAKREEKEAQALALGRPTVSPFFFPALGASALLVAFMVLMTFPPHPGISPAAPGESNMAAHLATPTPDRSPDRATPSAISPTAAPTAPESGGLKVK